MKIQEVKTQVYRNAHHGWTAETTRTEQGQTFQITTLKRYSGEVVTDAIKIEKRLSGGFVVTSFGMNDTIFSQNHGQMRATEKSVREAHFKGLAAFDRMISATPAEEIKKQEAEVGDIIFMDGYGKTKGSQGNHWIVYNIRETDFGTRFEVVEKDTLKLRSEDRARPYSEKFGIGMYFENGFNMADFGIDENRLSDMLIQAQEVKKEADERKRKEQKEADKKNAEKEAYLSQFTRADRRKTTTIIKNNCKKHFNISKIEVATDVFAGGDSMNVTYFSPEKIESLESFIKDFQAGHFNGMEDIYEYSNKEEKIIDGHILQRYKYVTVSHKQGAGKPQTQSNPTPEKEAEATPEDGKIQMRYNEEKNGIEIQFPGKPEREVLSQLKDLKFRWSQRQKIWYAIHSPELWEEAKKIINK